ncbi:MAG: family serine peptidase [Flaviaesturariibacter sp.]|nr:family serine peptidase [Flaviaesturariibacter sp.]
MNYRAVQLVLLLLSFSPVLFAQTAPAIYLKGGRITPASITPGSLDSFYQEAWFVKNQTYGLLQFEVAPTEATKMRLSAAGIELLQYIPDHSYTVSLVGKPSFEVLKGAGVRAIMSLHPEQKMDAWLSRGTLPHWAVKTNGTVDVLIAVVKTIPVEEAKELLKEKGLEVIATDLAAYHILKLRVASNRLKELANLPVIEYVQAAPPPDQPLNFNSRSLSRSALLNASVSDGGKGLNGEGVAVGIGDNADPQFHVDFSGRLINRSAYPVSLHGVHTTGIMAGAGIVNELYRGYAPKATIISQVFSGILTEAATYVQDYGMVLTNNSYGNIIDCEYDGNYDLYAQLLDQQAFDIPTLEHVFATGNSGGSTCAPYALGFHTVLGGYQSAKNVMSVGATTDSGIIATFSSRGPVKDGRLKPELTAMGQSVISTVPTNGYGFNSGTSMAAPAVSGGLALLYQRYRQLNGGVNPKSALMKALMCNGATDAGNTGPDFFYGFGNLNLLRSLEMLEGRNYFNTTVSNSAANNHTITVPANTAQLKVMLYWHDPAASLISSKTLVNDLDLEITTPAAATLLPKILDTASANLNAPAVMGADHLNNIEQIVIDNPGAGNYTLKVKGTAIGQGAAQEYVVVYDAIPVSLKLTYPIGGEALVPGERVKIQWDAYGDANTSFKLEYSIDGGTNWLLIASGLDAARRIYTWTVPATPTANAMVRAVKETTGATNSCSSFVIAGLPTLGLAPVQCDGYISINWTAAAGATDYEVMLLRGDSMAPIATTNALNYTFSGLNRDSVYWISVRARISGKPGRRAVAISRQPNSGTCTGTISNGDLRLAAITAPYSGRKFTSTQLSTTTAIQVQVKNLDDVAITGFTLKYRINAGGFVSEAVTATIAAGATFNYTFTTTADFSSPGNYTITAVVKNNAADPVTGNDTLITLIRHVDNQPVNLSTPFLDNLETAASITYTRDTVGLIGGDRYDYQHSTAFGRLLPFVNTGFAYSGTKAFTVDIDRYSVAGNTNYIIGTYNLAAYSSATSDLRLDFYYLNHGQPASAANKVWIRGSDTQPWIEAYDLNSHTEAGLYKKTGSIELSRLLAANGQNFSSSFSIRWGQFGQLPATMKEAGAGYTFDDIRLYQVTNDLQLVSIVEPLANSCALTATTPVKVAVRNSSFAVINNIPVRYRINSGAWIVESISAIGPNTTVT